LLIRDRSRVTAAGPIWVEVTSTGGRSDYTLQLALRVSGVA